MKLLIISDIHGSIENLDRLQEEFEASDAVLFAGDFARFGHTETALPVLENLCKKSDTIFSVIGNCDEPGFLSELEKEDISVQNALANWEGLTFTGCGGGTPFSGDTPNEREEDDILSDLNLVTSQGEQKWSNLVVIMHNPPKDTACDCVGGGVHVGSAKLRAFIETYSPLLVVTGHIHESCGIDKINDTTIVNPGAVMEGRYAKAQLECNDGVWSVEKVDLCTLM